MQRLEIVRIIQTTASQVLILQLSLDIKYIRDDMEYQRRISEIRSKTFLILRFPHIQIASIRLLLWQNACIGYNGCLRLLIKHPFCKSPTSFSTHQWFPSSMRSCSLSDKSFFHLQHIPWRSPFPLSASGLPLPNHHA